MAERVRFNGYYWRDADRVFWSRARVKGADVATFEALSETWARDRQRIFVQDSVLRGAHRESFRVLNAVYAKDERAVYFSGGRIAEADAATFEALDAGRHFLAPGPNGEGQESYGCDRAAVYHHAETIGRPSVVRGADPETFVSVDGRWGRDAERVYAGKSRIKTADPGTWYALAGPYSRDARRIYYDAGPLEGADPDTFICLPGSLGLWGKDNERFYGAGKPATQGAYLESLRTYVEHLEKLAENVRKTGLPVRF